MRKTLCCLIGMAAGTVLLNVPAMADDPALPGGIRGTTRNPAGEALPSAQVVVHSVEEKTDRNVTCGSDGTFVVENLKPGKYELVAQAQGFVSPPTVVELSPGETANVNIALASSVVASTSPAKQAVERSFWKRFAKAYADDWHDRTPSGPDAPFAEIPPL